MGNSLAYGLGNIDYTVLRLANIIVKENIIIFDKSYCAYNRISRKSFASHLKQFYYIKVWKIALIYPF